MAAARSLPPVAEEGAGRGDTTVRLARDLGLWDATLLGVGTIMGGGIFIMPGIAAGVTGPSVWLALALNALVTIPTLLAYAELSSAYHDAGGGYLWIREALGGATGFLGGWMSWFSHAVACAVYALASAYYMVFLFEHAGWFHGPENELLLKATALGFTLLFVGLNYVGVKVTAKAENATTVLVLVALAVFIAFGLLAIARDPGAAAARLHLGDWGSMAPFGFTGLFLTMGLTFIAFEGYEVVAQSSEEVKNPKRNVPLACLLSIAIMAPLLVVVGVISVAAVQDPAGGESWAWVAEQGPLGLVAGAGQFVPFGVGALVVLAGAMLSNMVALNSTIYSSSRVSFAMAREGELPARFAHISKRTQAPDVSIVISGALIAAMAMLLPIHEVAAAADIMFLSLFFLVNLSFIKLRRTTKGRLDFGFRAPLFPWLPLAGLVLQAGLAVALFLYSPKAWLAAGAWMLVGLAVYVAYARKPMAPPEPRAAVAFEVKAQRPLEQYHVLVPVANPGSIAPLAGVARDLARAKRGSVTLLHVITVPRATLPSAVTYLAEAAKPFLQEAARAFPADVAVDTMIKIAHDPATAILETAEEEGTDLILLGWRGRPTLRENLLGSTLDPVVRDAPCDVAVLRDGRAGEPRRMLVAARGRGRHAKLGAEVAGTLAKQRGAELVAVTVVTPGGHAEPEARLASIVADAGIGPWEASFRTVRAPTAEQGLHNVVEPGDLLVLGASEEPAWRATLFGTVPERVAARSAGSVLLVKRQTPAARLVTRAAARARRALAYLKPE